MFIFGNRLVNGEGFSWCFWLPINFCKICNILRDVPRKQISFLSPAVLFYFESSAISFPKTRYQNILDGIMQYIPWNTLPKNIHFKRYLFGVPEFSLASGILLSTTP